MRRTTMLLGLVGVFLAGAGAGAQAQTGAEITFTDHIRPIFERSCWNCHGEASQLSDLDLRTREAAVEGGVRGPALVPGRADDSRLFRMLAGLDDPPDAHGRRPPERRRAHGRSHLDRRRRALGRGRGHERRRGPGCAREHPAARRGARVLGVQAAEEGPGARLGRLRAPRRPLPRRRPPGGGGDGGAAGGRPDPGAPGLSGPHRPAPDPRADRRVPGRQGARGLGAADRPAARLAALRRALGPALDGRGPLRRLDGVRAGTTAATTRGGTATTSSTPSTTTSPTTSSCGSRSRATSSTTSPTRPSSPPGSCGRGRA